MKILDTDFYLVACYNKGSGYNRELSLRTTKQAPALKANEISIRCNLKLPIGLFQRPALSAMIEVPEDAIPATEIDMELASNIEELIQQNLDISMTVGIEGEQA